MQRARSLQLRGRSISQSDTRAQFHQDQTHFFVVHEAQIAIYETTKLSIGFRANPNFSCDSQLIHASFLDATECIFTARHLHMRCRYYSFSLSFTQYEQFKYPPSCCSTSRRSKAVCMRYVRW